MGDTILKSSVRGFDSLCRLSRKRKLELPDCVPKRSKLSISIVDLPLEMLLKIFSFLPRNEVSFQLSSVCQQWRNVIRDLWRKVILESSTPEKWLTIWLTELPQLKHLVVNDRKDVNAILEIVSQNCEHLESLELFSCDGSFHCPFISSKVMCNMTQTCKNLRYIRFELTRFHSWRFLKTLAKSIKTNQIKGGHYIGPAKWKNMDSFVYKLVQQKKDNMVSLGRPDLNLQNDIINKSIGAYDNAEFDVNYCIIEELAGM